MSALSELRNLIREIKNFLQSRLTAEFMNSVQAALNAIQETLGDPKLRAELKEVLHQLKILLEQANRKTLWRKCLTS